MSARRQRRAAARRRRQTTTPAPAPGEGFRCGRPGSLGRRCRRVVMNPGDTCRRHADTGPTAPPPAPPRRPPTPREEFPWSLVTFGPNGCAVGEPRFFRTEADAEAARPPAVIPSAVANILLNEERRSEDRRLPDWLPTVKATSASNNMTSRP